MILVGIIVVIMDKNMLLMTIVLYCIHALVYLQTLA